LRAEVEGPASPERIEATVLAKDMDEATFLCELKRRREEKKRARATDEQSGGPATRPSPPERPG